MNVHLERRIAVNTAILGVSEVVGQLANFGFVVLLTRTYGVELLGWYSFAMALGAVLAPFVSLGGVAYVTRELARDPGRAGALFAALRPVQLLTGISVWLAMVLTAYFAGGHRDRTLVIVAVGAYHVLQRMAGLYLAPAAAQQRLLSTAIVGGGHRVLYAGVAGLAIMVGCDAPIALLAMPAAAFVSLLAVRTMAEQGIQPTTVGAPVVTSRLDLVRASLPFLGTAVLAVIYSRGGVLMLTALRGEVETGLFAAGDRLLAPLYVLATMFAAAVYPALSSLNEQAARMQDLARRCLRLTLLVTIPAAAACAIFATDIITIVFGPNLRGAAPVLALLAPLVLLRSLSALWVSQCNAIGAEHRVAVGRGQALALFVATASIAIGLGGAAGLAVATVVGEAFFVWRLHRILVRQSRYSAGWHMAAAPAGAAVAAATAAAFAPGLSLPLRVILVAAILILVTVLLGGVRSHDVRFLREILGRGADRTTGRRAETWFGDRNDGGSDET